MSENATGMLLKKDVCIKGIFDPMDDDEMFHDDIFFQIPGLDEELDSGDMPKRISMAAVCVYWFRETVCRKSISTRPSLYPMSCQQQT